MTIGYDNWRPNQALLLDLQFREATGTSTKDFAKPYHDGGTLTGTPTWTLLASDLSYLVFDATNPDYIVLAAASTTDLDFTSGDFSGAAWFYPTSAGNRGVFCKGTGSTGWDFSNYGGAGVAMMRFATYQAGPTSQVTDGCDIALNAWHLVGFTRSGAAARVYDNGRDVTVTAGTHVNPATAAASNFYVGCHDGASAGWLYGGLWRPRVWGRALAAWEMLAIYEAERSLFGV